MKHMNPPEEKDTRISHPTGGTKTPPVSKGEVEQVGVTVPLGTHKTSAWPENWDKK